MIGGVTATSVPECRLEQCRHPAFSRLIERLLVVCFAVATLFDGNAFQSLLYMLTTPPPRRFFALCACRGTGGRVDGWIVCR